MIYWASRALMQKKKKKARLKEEKTELEHNTGNIDSSRGFRAHICTSHNFQCCYFPAGSLLCPLPLSKLPARISEARNSF